MKTHNQAEKDESSRLEQSVAAPRQAVAVLLGEYLLRLIGVVITIAALYFTWQFAVEREEWSVKQLFGAVGRELCRSGDWQADADRSVLLLAAGDRSIQAAEIAALKDALLAYHHLAVDVLVNSIPDVKTVTEHDALVVFSNGAFSDKEALQHLLAEVQQRALPMAWIGMNAADYLSVSGLDSSSATTPRVLSEDDRLDYQGAPIPLGGILMDVAFSGLDAGPGVSLKGQIVTQSGESAPFAWLKERQLIMPVIPFNDMQFSLILPAAMDALSDLFGNHRWAPRILLRLEDLNGKEYAGEGGNAVRLTSEYLLDEKVFMHLSVIPEYVDADGRLVARINQSAAVKALISNHPQQVEVVQHGYRHHRLDGRNQGLATGEAFEFFSDDDLVHGEQWSREFIQERLQLGREILRSLGVQPRVFEAPHYTLSPVEERVAGEQFDLLHHPPLYQSGVASDLLYPWFSQKAGVTFAPSAVGYVAANNPESVNDILYRLDLLQQIMPDPVVVVHFHPFMRVMAGREQDLDNLVKGARSLGYRFDSSCGLLSGR